MKKFKFRLEPLMRYREFLERQKQLEVARARSDVVLCEESIEQTRTSHMKTADLLEKKLTEGMDAARFLHFHGYMSGLASFEAAEEKRRTQLIGVLTQRQKELAKKSVEKKAIEKLKLRRKEEYYTAMLKAEQKELDDIVVIRGTGSLDK